MPLVIKDSPRPVVERRTPARSTPAPVAKKTTTTRKASTSRGAVAPNAAPAPVGPTPDELVRQQYPQYIAYLDQPEIGPILRKAAAEGWDSARLQGAILATSWWKTTSQITRTWDALVNTDPAEANRQIGAQAAVIWDQARKLGFNANSDLVQQLAKSFLREGWNQNQLIDTLVQHMVIDGGQGGEAGTLELQLDKLAADYLVPLDANTKNLWIRQMLMGEQDVDGFTNYMRDQAKSLFPPIADFIDQGGTAAQYANPYKNMAVETLGINEAEVNWNDSKWRAALTQVDKEGNRIPMNLDDWQRKLKTDTQYGYDKTTKARNESASFANELLKKFGFQS